MTADILTNIHNKLTTFSKGQRRIATYILESYDKAAFLTAGALGKITQVSESTVVRFAAELGYDGYPAMQRALQEMVLNRLTSVQRIEVTDERLGEQDVVSTILQADMDRLRHTNEHLDREAFSGAVEALLQARCIYVLGVRSSAALASSLSYYLHYMFENVRLITTPSTSEVFEQLVRISPQDAVIGISFPRYSTATGNDLRACLAAVLPRGRRAGHCPDGLRNGPHRPQRALSAHGQERHGLARGFARRADERCQRPDRRADVPPQARDRADARASGAGLGSVPCL